MIRLRAKQEQFTISEPLHFLLKRHYFISKKYHSILNYGDAGTEEAAFLRRQGYNIRSIDPFLGDQLGSEETFDTVICINLLTLLKVRKRRAAIEGAWGCVANGGVLFVATLDGVDGADLVRLTSDLPNKGYTEVCERTDEFPYIIITKQFNSTK